MIYRLMAEYCTDGLAVWDDVYLIDREKLPFSKDLLDRIEKWVDYNDLYSFDNDDFQTESFWITGLTLAKEMANQIQKPIKYFNEHLTDFQIVEPNTK